MNTILESPVTVDENELETRVKKMYTDVARHPEVTYHFEMGRSVADRLGYPSDDLDVLPQQSIESFAGVGYFFDLADLQKGEHVLDLGSGSGMDVFFAAEKVGKSGRVSGVDMTPDQLRKSNRQRSRYGYNQVEFLESHIEKLPFQEESFDAVISNGVINLSANKKDVFAEAARVLRIGGRLAIADIVSSVDLPENISCDATLWAACIGGAIKKQTYLTMIEEAGLALLEVKNNPYQFLSKSARGATQDYGIQSISILAVKI